MVLHRAWLTADLAGLARARVRFESKLAGREKRTNGEKKKLAARVNDRRLKCPSLPRCRPNGMQHPTDTTPIDKWPVRFAFALQSAYSAFRPNKSQTDCVARALARPSRSFRSNQRLSFSMPLCQQLDLQCLSSQLYSYLKSIVWNDEKSAWFYLYLRNIIRLFFNKHKRCIYNDRKQ